MTTNITIDVDEENNSASAESYYAVFQGTDTLPLEPIVSGRYHDHFERVEASGASSTAAPTWTRRTDRDAPRPLAASGGFPLTPTLRYSPHARAARDGPQGC